MFKALKEYMNENKDTLFTVALILILDEYIFSGAFRDKIKAILDGMLKKAEKKVEA